MPDDVKDYNVARQPVSPATPPDAEVATRRHAWLLPANIVTLFRLLLLPVFAAMIIGGQLKPALIILVLIAVSDFVDGFIARRFNQVTTFGTRIDPIADRLAMLVTSGSLAFVNFIPWWLVAVLAVPDLILAILVRGTDPPPVSWIGKARTALLLLGFPLILVGHAWTWPVVVQVAAVLLLLGAVGHLIAGAQYGRLIVLAKRELGRPA